VLRKHNASQCKVSNRRTPCPFAVTLPVPPSRRRTLCIQTGLTNCAQVRDAEDSGRIDQRVPQGDRVVEEQEEEQEGQGPAGRYRVDVEGTGGPRQVFGRSHRAEPVETGRGIERSSCGVLLVLDEVHGGPVVAARYQRSQVRLHRAYGKVMCLQTRSGFFPVLSSRELAIVPFLV